MTGMNFNTSNQTFRQLMANGLSYRVPPFQRDYSWSGDEWDDLWQDIRGLYGEAAEPAHYMGYLVLQSSDGKRFDIIDGQQRMTTLTLLILAGISHLQDLADAEPGEDKNRRRAEQLRNGYIGYLDPVTLIPESKLRLNRHNDRFYQSYRVPLEHIPQRGLSASEHLLRKAFVWFKDRIKDHAKSSGEEVARFIDSVVDKLLFTVIAVTDELNAFKVFETLNARGVRLSSTDLLKNYLFSVIHASDPHDSEMKALENRWEGIIGLLGSERFPEFLRVFWNSRNKLARKTDLFKTIRKQVTAKGEAFQLIRELDADANIYKALRDPQDPFWSADEKSDLKKLRIFNVRQPLALLLTVYNRFAEADRKTFKRVLRAISVISFRYNVICNMQSSQQERIYNRVAVGVSTGELNSKRQIIQALNPLYPEDGFFQEAFREKELRTTNSRNKKVARYILFELERHASGRDYDFESNQYTIEHVLPEGADAGWRAFDDRQQAQAVYRLGNMTLMSAGKNRELGNCDYPDKRDLYINSAFEITRRIAREYDEWTPDKIDAHQAWMARQAKTIWRIDF